MCGYYGSVAWFVAFIGGIVLFHRVYEKTFRDVLENIREGYKTRYEKDNSQGDLVEIENVTTALRYISRPVQTEVNRCAIWGMLILAAQALLNLLNISCLSENYLNGGICFLQFLFTVGFTVGCFSLYKRAERTYKRTKRRVKAIDIAYSKQAANRAASLG